MSSTVLEDVARIIDPEPWAQVDRWYVHGERVNVDRSIVKPSVDKARTILALIPGRDEAALPEADTFEALVAEVMADTWNEICSDTECHPTDIEQLGRKRLGFRPRHWSSFIAGRLRSSLAAHAAAPPPPPVAELPGDVETLVTALNGLRAEWHRQAEAYEKDSKKSEPATNREMARSYSALLDRVASDLKLTITCATQASRAPTETGEGR